MLKVIYFDLGGVIFFDFYSGADLKLAKALKLPREKVYQAYVKTDFPQYCSGKMTDEERWKKFLKEVNLSEKNIDLCLKLFLQGYQPIWEMVNLIKKIRREFSQINLGVLSDQPKIVASYLRENYKRIFDLFNQQLIFISAEVGLTKQDKNLDFFWHAIKKSQVTSEEILFIDNSKLNIKRASKLGMKTFLFEVNDQPLKSITKSLENKIYSYLKE